MFLRAELDILSLQCGTLSESFFCSSPFVDTGVEILGESQLVGYPELPELNLQPQFPSVALLNWTNGLGNARYHVLKVLIENFEPGDKLVQTEVMNGECLLFSPVILPYNSPLLLQEHARDFLFIQ